MCYLVAAGDHIASGYNLCDETEMSEIMIDKEPSS